MGIDIAALVDQHYPLARTCSHSSTKESLEQEADDDRYYDIIVTRCSDCGFPQGDRYATAEEVERFRNETAKR